MLNHDLKHNTHSPHGSDYLKGSMSTYISNPTPHSTLTSLSYEHASLIL